MVSCYSGKQKKTTISKNCNPIFLPNDSSILKEFNLLPDTILNDTRYRELSLEIAIKNKKQQEKFGLLSHPKKNEFYLISEKFVEKNLEIISSDSVYATRILPYKIIKLKNNYLLVNYYETELSILCYKPQTDSITVIPLGKVDKFIGSSTNKRGNKSYLTFAFKSSQMNIDMQEICILTYYDTSDIYKITSFTINKKEYGIHGDCDTLISKKYSIDYAQGIVSLFLKNDVIIDSI